MAKPTGDPSWATDADYPAGPQTYAGTPTKTEPDAGRKATGWEPGLKPPAQHFSWWMNLVAKWLLYLDSLFDTSDALTLSDVFTTVEYDHGLHASAFTATPGGTGTYTGSLWTFSGAGTLTVPLPFLKPDDVITTIEHDYTRGGAGTVTFSLFRRVITVGGGITNIQTDADTTTTVEQNITLTYGHKVLAGNMYYMTVSATNAANLYVGAVLKASRPHP